MTLRRAVYVDMANGIRIALHNSQRQGTPISREQRGIALATRTISEALKRENSSFRYDHFFAACELDDWGHVPGDPQSPAQAILLNAEHHHYNRHSRTNPMNNCSMPECIKAIKRARIPA